MANHGQPHKCLLLLPCPPAEISIETLKIAYGPAVTHVLQDLSRISIKGTNVSLDLAIAHTACPDLDYVSTQKLVGVVYTVICMISADNSIDVQFGNEVETDVIIFRSGSNSQADFNDVGMQRFVDISKLATSEKDWDNLYSSESEAGHKLLLNFLSFRDSSTTRNKRMLPVSHVPGGLSMKSNGKPSAKLKSGTTGAWKGHHSVAVGGTFDHLHPGHKLLLTMTTLVLDPIDSTWSNQNRCLTIGITGDDLLKQKKYIDEVQDWDTRQSAVQQFLLNFLSLSALGNKLKYSRKLPHGQGRGREVHDELESGVHIRYVEIFEQFGPTITDSEISALVLSGETRNGGQAVNAKRAELQWQPLEIYEVDVLQASDTTHSKDVKDFQGKISSTDIRSRIYRKRTAACAQP